MAYDRLLEMDHLEHARDTDIRYHLAKLMAWATWEPQLLHDEHAEWRASVLGPEPQQMTREVLEARALALFKRSRERMTKAGAH